MLVDVATGLPAGYESFGLMMCDSWTGRELASRGIPVEVLPLTRAFDTSWPVRFARYLRKHRIDLVHSHEFTGNCYATAGARLAGIPIVCTTHGKNYWPYRLYRRQAYRWVCNNSRAFVAVSKDLAEFTATTLGIALSKVAIVLNGIDTRAFAPNSELRDSIRAQWGVSAETRVLLSVGELSEVKGHEYLIRAYAQMGEARASTLLAIAGDGPLRTHLERLATELGCAERIKFLGHRRDVPALLNAADLFVMPSLSEGLPLAILEAMAARLPIVASGVGGIPEVIKPGSTGWLVPPQGVAELAATLCKVLAADAESKHIADAGHRLCLNDYALEATIHRYLGLYHGAE